MAKITMELIKELREKTQVGMMDCKKALISADGDIERAIEILRKKGADVAAKRAEHATNNGRIASFVAPDHKTGALIEISCETDFSANTDDIKNFAQTTCEHLANTTQCSQARCEPECLIEQKLFNDPNKTIKTLLDELIAKISENIKISKCSRFTGGEKSFINAYIHPGATLGTMIDLEVDGITDQNKKKLAELAKNLCMQIAVFNPLCVEPSQLDAQTLEKEQCIIKEQLKAAGKPDQIIEKIMIGKINKYYEEVCLIKQKYIKEDKINIEKYLENIGKEIGCSISIKQFTRFVIGK
jgi:elongation factor Ts